MKKAINTILIFTIVLLLQACGVFQPYERPVIDMKGLYRDTLSNVDTLISDAHNNIGNLPWFMVFEDAYLQELIQRGLLNNIDLRIAIQRVEASRAQFVAAGLAYFPSLNVTPSGGIASYDTRKAIQTYELPIATSWEIDIAGRLTNSKRAAKARLLQSEAYQQYVRTQVIANIANYYFTLLTLDKQLEISVQTLDNWGESINTMRALKEAGVLNETAIVQGEANLYEVATTIPDLKYQIRSTENALCLLLGEKPHAIPRGQLDAQNIPDDLSAGVPVQLLENRPDIKEAEMALAAAYANTNVARAAFYPQLNISGTSGWTNAAGTAVTTPTNFFASATASLIQPIFNRGLNRAQLRVALAQQEEARLTFLQAILNAGNEVSNALYQYKAAMDKNYFRQQQIQSLVLSVSYTQQLLKLSSSTYLEVLTAQQSLLAAQLSQVADQQQRLQAVVNLYQALGGGREILPNIEDLKMNLLKDIRYGR